MTSQQIRFATITVIDIALLFSAPLLVQFISRMP